MLPDEPLWVETRWMLLSGDGRLISCPPDGAIVIGSRLRTAAVIGRDVLIIAVAGAIFVITNFRGFQP